MVRSGLVLMAFVIVLPSRVVFKVVTHLGKRHIRNTVYGNIRRRG